MIGWIRYDCVNVINDPEPLLGYPDAIRIRIRKKQQDTDKFYIRAILISG